MVIDHHTFRLPDVFTHSHEDEYEIMYCVEGSCEFHFGSDLRGGENHYAQYKAKTLIFIPMGVPHGVEHVQYPYDRYSLRFGEAVMERFQGENTIKAAFFARAEETDEEKIPQVCIIDVSQSADKLEALLEQMYDICFMPDIDASWRELNLESLLGLFWCEVYRNHKHLFVHSLSQYTKPVRKVKSYMDHHYNQALSMEMLAGQCYLSPNYLSKLFRSQVGMSPHKYLTQKRLGEARKLLCSTQLPIQEVSMRTGFCDVNCFIQQFKKYYGETPKKYKRLEAARSEM